MEMLKLLVITDLHYASCEADTIGSPTERCCPLGCELIKRVIADARHRGGFDCLAIIGDLLNRGTSPRAGEDLKALQTTILSSLGDTPLLIVPGNHDNDIERLMAAFAQRPGVHDVGPYRFITFADAYAEGDLCTRSESGRRLLADQAGNIIVLQHNPMNPPIENDYPYMLTNRREVMADYSAAGVMLSISGHYHKGQSLNVADGVRYFTAPAVCEAPFRYAMITLRGREVDVELRPLAVVDEPGIIDCHAHTEFAYCGKDVTAKGVIARARTFGLTGQCLTEHAGQLYCNEKDFWAARHIREPSVWHRGENSRMDEFKAVMLPLRDGFDRLTAGGFDRLTAGGFVRVGLEVGLDADGQLTIRDEDRDWPDLLIGAVHWIPENPDELNDTQLADAFMRASRGLAESGVDILAHPWRFFRREKRPTPKELYGDLADILAATDTAAEINFHTNAPDPAFIAECIARGVKIALLMLSDPPAHQPPFVPWVISLSPQHRDWAVFEGDENA